MAELTGGRCLCRCCNRTFRNLAAFDDHHPDRAGCGDPTSVGLVEQDGIWATPEGHAQREQVRALAERNRAARRAPHRVAQSDEHPPTHPEVPL